LWSFLKVIEAVERCRTAALGCHIERCDSCGFERPAYNSCRNRHCPKCQSLAKLKWLEKQKSEILPVGYFHLVFTLPHELNKKILLSHLFKAVGETLVDFGSTGLGGQIGFITVRHTWDQTLLDHFHLHCLVPAGALSFEQKRWTPARKNFLFPVKALSIVFRGKFLDFLKKACDRNKLLFVGQTASLADPVAFQLLINALRKKPWIVYANNHSDLMYGSNKSSASRNFRRVNILFLHSKTAASRIATASKTVMAQGRYHIDLHHSTRDAVEVSMNVSQCQDNPCSRDYFYMIHDTPRDRDTNGRACSQVC
jgi:hypothetical protein